MCIRDSTHTHTTHTHTHTLHTHTHTAHTDTRTHARTHARTHTHTFTHRARTHTHTHTRRAEHTQGRTTTLLFSPVQSKYRTVAVSFTRFPAQRSKQDVFPSLTIPAGPLVSKQTEGEGIGRGEMRGGY